MNCLQTDFIKKFPGYSPVHHPLLPLGGGGGGLYAADFLVPPLQSILDPLIKLSLALTV